LAPGPEGQLSAAEIEEAMRTATLDLSGRELTALPAQVTQLTGLHTLRLDDNGLTILPAEVGQLSHLQTLRLDNNRLTRLPPEIGQLSHLQTLSLVDNQLGELPAEIGQLANLETLRLDNNHLTSLPPEIGDLSGLWEFTVPRNKLTSLPPEIGQLARLFRVRLDSNQLALLPPEFGTLTELSLVWLFDNALTSLPPEIGKLAKLHELRLERNGLTVLPRQLADLLVNGLDLRLEGNPLHEPLPEFIERGSAALATYLRSLEDAVPQYEAKLLLVGEGNVGKTSLIAALRDEPFVDDRPTTHGIEIKPLTLHHPHLNADMTVRAWDFGGQEVYRVTHQFFFSRRALYLVVWNAREGQEQNEVEGWLRRIRLRVGGDARVIVVATHRDERQPELDYPSLEQAFPGILSGKYEVDNKSRRDIPELLQGISKAAAHLPQMGQMMSTRWTEAREDILARARCEPQIPYTVEEDETDRTAGFVEICKAHRMGPDEITTLAELMHDLGQIVYYSKNEGLRDFVVLDPEWLTKAISYVLEDEETRKNKGVLKHAWLKRILEDRQDGPAYPAHYHPYFLRLMEKFDVSYRLDDDEDSSLVAQLVPHDRPGLPWDTRTPPATGKRSLSVVCQLSEPAPGLVAWLTVRHHRASTGRHWRNGVFLRHPINAYDSEALLELRAPDQLTLDVRAPSPDLYFNVLRDSVEDLISRRWPGISYRLNVPCPTRSPEGQRCPGQFPLDGLLSYRENGGTRTFCFDCHVDHDLSQLLTGFALPDVALGPQLERLEDQLTDVRSGVERLEGYAADSAASMRRVLRAVGTEITDCPRLFTLTEEDGRRWSWRFQHHYRLVLWCEHPGHWHPWPPANYIVDQPRSWLVQVGPYAALVFKALQVALQITVPLAASVANTMLTPDQLKSAEQELATMGDLLGSLTAKNGDEDDFGGESPASQLRPAEGKAARELRVLLFERDRNRTFGGLHRVQAPSGDLVWVCDDHYRDYDPGLPVIPRPQ
jgi:internalin A